MSDSSCVTTPEPQEMATQPKRSHKGGLWIPLIVIVALLVVASAVWMDYTRSPRYSVGQLARAAADNDWDGVQKYVDVDAVVSDLVDTGTTGTFGEDDWWLGDAAAGLAESVKPALARAVKDALRTGIEMGPDRSDAAVDLAGLFAVRSVKSVSYAGDEALVTVEAPYGEERTVEFTLRMKRVDDFWRVIAIEDLPALETSEDQ